MPRWLTITGFVGLAIAGAVALAIGLPRGDSGRDLDPPSSPAKAVLAAPAPGQPASTVTPVVEVNQMPGAAGPLVVPGCRIVVMHRQEVPSLRDGQLLYIATEVKDGESVPPNRLLEIPMRYVVVPVKPGQQKADDEIIAVPGTEVKLYRKVKEGEHLDPEQVVILRQPKRFKRLSLGDSVKEGDSLAMVDPRLALDELSMKLTKVIAAGADREASAKTRDEAKNRYDREINLRNVKATSQQDIDGALLTWQRYLHEEVSKRQAIVLSEHELKQTQTVLEMHTIRSKINGVVKAIYKHPGEAVKNLEPVLLLQDPHRLRIEGLVDLQNAQHLKVGDEVIVEASKVQRPEIVLRGHMQEVTCVAVSAGSRLILSGSEDRTVRVWDRTDGKQLYTIRFAKPVKALAFTPPGTAEELGVVGVTDGTAWLVRNLTLNTEPTLVALQGNHKGAVNCAAFSPDGKLVATGGDDHLIRLWDTATGALKHTGTSDHGHRGAVTSLHFADNTKLVSAGRGDNAVLVWNLAGDGTLSVARSFPRRGGDVADLGVSPNGQYTLFDQGKDLQVLSLKTGQIEGVLYNSSPAISFTTMALFSPKDGKLILTASASENRVQLYRTPSPGVRGAEVRQLAWPTAAATCGDFAPNGNFLVTGMRDRTVLVWQMPNEKEQDVLKARLTLVERSLDSSTRQVRIAAEVDNPGHLLPGDSATLVIDAK